MYRRISHLFFPDPAMWIAMISMGLLLAVWSYLTDFSITFGGDPTIFYLVGAGITVGVVYHKRSPGMATFGFCFGLFMLMAVILRPLSYLAVSEQFAIIDPVLAQIDRFIGFDWNAHIGWVNERPVLLGMLQWAYDSLVLQLVFIFTVFYVTANYERLREFIMVFFIMGFVTTILVTFFPAAGASYIYQPGADLMTNMASVPGSYSLEHFFGLHNGDINSVTITNSIGLITFPSFHTEAAVLYIWAVRRTIMFWPSFVLNVLMIISTISIGGHYIIDLVAGIALTMVVAYVYGLWAGRYRLSLTTPRVHAIADATGFEPGVPVIDQIRTVLSRSTAKPVQAKAEQS